MLGMSIQVLSPGEPNSMYHWEADEEDFLVLAGEALLLVEGQERPLRQSPSQPVRYRDGLLPHGS